MGYWQATIVDANFSMRGHVYGETVKELQHNFVVWKKKHGIPVNSANYWLVDRIWVNWGHF